ncbi:AGAP000631-PA-like protein [Anopheles sinensis]|uniref:AGAP000631-PA-like protein n=1 Tax=Anopheles sinensis TaxID=74873 RepID=A0A084W3L1_ANOSI|nr:AGAP000631-PA-like protein [Anopheles sinensis]
MTIVLFVLDTSPLMFQRAFIDGKTMTYLDIAKQTVEKFLKARKTFGLGENDRYMLMTCEQSPNHVKSGWKASLETFMSELKNLQQSERQSMGLAIKHAFDFLNHYWLGRDIDRFGNGRCPFYHDPTMVIVLSHGAWTDDENLFNLMQTSSCDLMLRRYRWDQRLFIIALRIPGNYVEPCARENRLTKIPCDEVMNRTCCLTGGTLYSITSGGMLKQCILELVESLQRGVVLEFNCPPAISLLSEVCFVIETNRPHCGHWPIPESYWVELICETLPPREAHPQITIIFEPSNEPDIRHFPYDSYTLKTSELVMQIVSNAPPGKVLPVFVNTDTILDKPFGYLKLNVARVAVKLIVLAYDYPVLLPLMRDLIRKYRMNPPRGWLGRFQKYAFTIPKYYYSHMRLVFRDVMKIPEALIQRILPPCKDYMPLSAALHLKKTQMLAAKVQQQIEESMLQRKPAFPTPALAQVEVAPLMETVIHPCTFQSNIVVPSNVTKNVTVYNYRDPYQTPRRELINAMAKMRDEFWRNTPVETQQDNASRRLGASNYTSKSVMLHCTEEQTNETQQINNNPYHKRMTNQLKRKVGPISKDFIFERYPAPKDTNSRTLVSTDASGPSSVATELSSIVETDEEVAQLV